MEAPLNLKTYFVCHACAKYFLSNDHNSNLTAERVTLSLSQKIAQNCNIKN